MATIFTSLPLFDNDGNSTALARENLFSRLALDGVRFTKGRAGVGLWADENGELYRDEIEFWMLSGDEKVIRKHLGQFGVDARQLAVLCVKASPVGSHFVEVRQKPTETDLRELCAAHGGATLLKDANVAFSLRYAALEANVDYAL